MPLIMVPKLSSVLSLIMLLFLFMFPLSSHAKLSPSPNGEKLSSFEFIKDLQGYHKGDKVKGIHKLKKYLQQFGYLSKNINHADADAADDDDFDDLVESAIKTYQTNYHLKATGSLDSETVSEMVKPRCGIADIINDTNWMHSGTKPQYSFFIGEPRWPDSKSHLTYALLSSVPSEARSTISQAFEEWASATHFTFEETQDVRSADLTVGSFSGEHGDGAPFDGLGGILAHAFAPTDGIFHYDADETWAIGAVPNAMDLETVAVHEIGHLLGLGHSSVPDAIMFPTIPTGVTKQLHEDDIQGIQALYEL